MVSMISVAVLPMSICPHVMPKPRPSSSMLLVSPVIACLVTEPAPVTTATLEFSLLLVTWSLLCVAVTIGW
jgi:hypothetical protein